jgi:hypothetical protein
MVWRSLRCACGVRIVWIPCASISLKRWPGGARAAGRCQTYSRWQAEGGAGGVSGNASNGRRTLPGRRSRVWRSSIRMLPTICSGFSSRVISAESTDSPTFWRKMTVVCLWRTWYAISRSIRRKMSDGGLAEDIAPRAELKTMRYFRNNWSKLSVHRHVKQAIEQVPDHAGPLNSHLLMLRSLALMRDISPDYLNRFVSYIDTLLWLDQADRTSRPTAKRIAQDETVKKMKGARARSR